MSEIIGIMFVKVVQTIAAKMGHEISYLSGVYWLIGTFLTFSICALIIEVGRMLYWRYKFSHDRKAREIYSLSATKDREEQD